MAAGRVDRLHGRQEEQVAAGFVEHPGVALRLPGVAVEILAGPELRRVDEDRDDHERAAPAGDLDEREVPRVERSHGRHETDLHPVAAQLAHRHLELGRFTNGSHAP